LNLNGILVIV
jgi:hypothetical protein